MIPWAVDHILTAVILLPVTCGFVLMAVNSVIAGLRPGWFLPEGIWWSLSFLVSLGVFAMTLVEVVWVFDPQIFGPQFVERIPWVPTAGVTWLGGVDGLSLVLIALTTGLVPLVLIVARRQISQSHRSFIFCVLMVETGLLGVFLALDPATVFLMWQLTVLPTFLLVGRWGQARRVQAALRFGAAWSLGSMLFLWALLMVTDGGTLALYGPPALEGTGLLQGGVGAGEGSPRTWVLIAFLLSLGLTIPMFPFHVWWSQVDRETPLALSIFLNAAGLKVGGYFLIRWVLPLCGDAIESAQPLLFFIAVSGMLYALARASLQNDFRRFISWWTTGQLAFIALGVLSLDDRGLSGAVMTMLSHGLTCAVLLLLFGALYERRKTSDLRELGGLARPMPVFSSFLAIGVLSAMGLPPLIGFAGEFMMLMGLSSRHLGVASLTLLAWVVGAAAGIRFYRRIAWGPLVQPENRGLIDLRLGERIIMLSILLPIVGFGVYPSPILRRIEPTSLEILRLVDGRLRKAPHPISEMNVSETEKRETLIVEPGL